jgi:hypothetical protein
MLALANHWREVGIIERILTEELTRHIRESVTESEGGGIVNFIPRDDDMSSLVELLLREVRLSQSVARRATMLTHSVDWFG